MSRRVLLTCFVLAGLLCAGCGVGGTTTGESSSIPSEPLPSAAIEEGLPAEIPAEES